MCGEGLCGSGLLVALAISSTVEIEARPFSPRTEGLPNVQATPGLLLPSASVLQRFVGQPMRWKVRLNHPPRHQLKYYFLRSSVMRLTLLYNV